MRPSITLPDAPGHLKADGLQLWNGVVEVYDLDAGGLALLEVACKSWDRYHAARRILDSEGEMRESRFGEMVFRPEHHAELKFAKLTRDTILKMKLELPAGVMQ